MTAFNKAWGVVKDDKKLIPLGKKRPSQNTFWMCSQCGENAHYYLEDEDVRAWDDHTFLCRECAGQ
tara:strand:+ start:1592 stop:1789 length:198 start_codon:yes stop_codon:yes gene_type:complete